MQRVFILAGDQGQAGGLGHFNHGRFSVGQQAIAGRYGFSGRAGDAPLNKPAAGGIHQRLHGPLAAVGHRRLDTIGLRQHPPYPLFKRIGNLQGGQVSLEGIRREDNLHYSAPASPASIPARPVVTLAMAS